MKTRIKDSLLFASIHGLKHIAEPKRHTIERLCWVGLVILAWAYSLVLMLDAWDSYKNNAIQFTVDTAYLDWNTEFPSITFCESSNLNRLKPVAKELFNDTSPNLRKLLGEIVYYMNDLSNTMYSCFEPPNGSFIPSSGCPHSNLSRLSRESRSPCQDIFLSCKWNDIQIDDCCKYFLPLETEYGICYSINNIHAIHNMTKRGGYFPLTSNRTTGPGTLRMDVTVDGLLFWHGNADIPNRNMNYEELKMRRFYPIHFRVLKTFNQPEVRDVSIDQRNCRFPTENPLRSFRFYSQTACVVECRKRAHLEMCGCVSYVMPGIKGGEECNLTSQRCIARISAGITLSKSAWSSNPGLYCPCEMDCDTQEIKTHKITTHGYKKQKIGVQFFLDSLPTVRYERKVVRGALDLVVSMGGTAGLLSGASFLSFVEVIYLLCLRRYKRNEEETAKREESGEMERMKRKQQQQQILRPTRRVDWLL